MKSVLKVIGGLIVLLVAVGVGWLLAASGAGRAADPASLTELERVFAERMQNVALEGHFTIEGRERRDGNPELYEISRGHENSRETGGDSTSTSPMAMSTRPLLVVVPIVWAGDTPMVSITDFAIPGLGEEFGARVIFYDDRYAGTWDHGQYGGMMYGTIRSMETAGGP